MATHTNSPSHGDFAAITGFKSGERDLLVRENRQPQGSEVSPSDVPGPSLELLPSQLTGPDDGESAENGAAYSGMCSDQSRNAASESGLGRPRAHPQGHGPPRTDRGKDRSARSTRSNTGYSPRSFCWKVNHALNIFHCLNGLRDDSYVCLPVGALETVLVENLGVLFWRKRRLLSRPRTPRSRQRKWNSRKLTPLRSSAWKQWEHSRSAICLQGGLLKLRIDNPIIVRGGP